MKTYPVGSDAFTPCGTDTHECTHILKIDLGNIIEIVLFSFGGDYGMRQKYRLEDDTALASGSVSFSPIHAYQG
uniref:Uncharacterized protein n=1 Tax=Magallana gigas TaxID=29159 RepID=K1QFF5_MAGGI